MATTSDRVRFATRRALRGTRRLVERLLLGLFHLLPVRAPHSAPGAHRGGHAHTPADADGVGSTQRAPGDRTPVTFLIWNVHAMGGTVRTVLRQAEGLVGRGHPVRVVAVLCHDYQQAPFFTLPDGVEMEVLVDRHHLQRRRGPGAAVARWLDRRPSLLRTLAHGREKQASLLTDLRTVLCVARTRDVIMGTRFGLTVTMARTAHPEAITVGQEHLSIDRLRGKPLRAAHRWYPRLDLVVCLTEAEREHYHDRLGDGCPPTVVLPNALPDELPDIAPDAVRPQRVIALGRLDKDKNHGHVIRAFLAATEGRSDWELVVVGAGRQRCRLESLVERHGASDRVRFPGATDDVTAALRDAAVFVSASRFESFGLVLLEAMAARLPVVAYAAPQGPRELLTDGHDALLVPVGDVDGLARCLRRLLDDEQLRRELGERGRHTATRYRNSDISERWSVVIEQLVADRRAAGRDGGSGLVDEAAGSPEPSAGSRLT